MTHLERNCGHNLWPVVWISEITSKCPTSSSSVKSLHYTSRGFFNWESLILFSTLPHHFCCLPPSPPSGQSLKQDWQSLQCFLLPYNSSVLVPILVALGPHWVPISLSGSLSIKISIHSLCSSICFLLSKNGICSRPRLMTILFHFLPSFFTLTIGKTVLETWHLRHWLQFWQLRTWIQTIILTWQLIVTLDSIHNSCDVWYFMKYIWFFVFSCFAVVCRLYCCVVSVDC